jgi:hypothetical protein
VSDPCDDWDREDMLARIFDALDCIEALVIEDEQADP